MADADNTPPAMIPGDLFAAAEREIAEADRLASLLPDDDDEEAVAECDDRYTAAAGFIAYTEPQSLADVVVKLRFLLVPYAPLTGHGPEIVSVRQCVEFLEGQLQQPRDPT